MRYILLVLILLFITGCNQNEKPKILKDSAKQKYAKEIVSSYAKSDADNKKEIALIDMKKEIEKEKIKAKREIEIAKIEKEKEIEKNKIALKKEEDKIFTIKLAIYIFFILLAVFLILFFIILRRYQEKKIELEKEKIKSEKEIKEKEIRADIAKKIIDAISKGNLTNEQEEKLFYLSESKNIIEYKKR